MARKTKKLACNHETAVRFFSIRNVAEVSACNDKSARTAYWARNMDDTPEQLWQRIVRENPCASDEDVQCLFIAALIDDEDLRLQLLERFFKDMRKKLLN
jgi:hypothetical protein